MKIPTSGQTIAIVLSLILAITTIIIRSRIRLPANDPAMETEDPSIQEMTKKRRMLMILSLIAFWLLSGLVLGLFAPERETFNVTISPPRVDLLGMSTSTSVIITWIVMAVLALIGAVIRFFIIPRFKDRATGFQLVLETMVEVVSDFTKDKFHGHRNEGLAAYFFALALMFIGSSFVELLGIRPPTTDLTMTLSYALVTFILIQYTGVRHKGASRHLKSFSEPNAMVTPFKILSEIAIPISLACRLFGNMLGGMIVVDLVYMAMGSFAIGIPAVIGLYFNAFHPLIQVFIFINLSLTFIADAAEETALV